MRKLIATLLLLFWPGALLSPSRAFPQRAVFLNMNVRPATTGGGSFTATSNGCGNESGSSTSVACTLSGSLTAGQTIVVEANGYLTKPTTIAFSHTQGGTITTAVAETTWGPSGSLGYAAVAVITGVTAGSDTITATFAPGTQFASIVATVFTGGALDVAATPNIVTNGAANPGLCNSLTTTSANELIVEVVQLQDDNPFSNGTTPQTMTLANTSSGSPSSSLSGIFSGTAVTAGSNTATFGNSATDMYVCNLIALK